MIPIKLQRKFIETALRHGCSCVNLLHIFRTPFPKNTSEWLLMYLSQSLYHNFCYDLHIINTSKPSSTFTYLRWDLQSLHLPLQSYVILQGFLSKIFKVISIKSIITCTMTVISNVLVIFIIMIIILKFSNLSSDSRQNFCLQYHFFLLLS